MTAGVLLSLLAIVSLINVNWAPTINTVLLILLALVQIYAAAKANRHGKEVEKLVPEVADTKRQVIVAKKQVIEANHKLEEAVNGHLDAVNPLKGGKRDYDPSQ